MNSNETITVNVPLNLIIIILIFGYVIKKIFVHRAANCGAVAWAEIKLHLFYFWFFYGQNHLFVGQTFSYQLADVRRRLITVPRTRTGLVHTHPGDRTFAEMDVAPLRAHLKTAPVPVTLTILFALLEVAWVDSLVKSGHPLVLRITVAVDQVVLRDVVYLGAVNI